MFVVFDTNIWLSELGLTPSLGAATRFFLRRKAARIALPEVIRLETERHIQKQLSEHVIKIAENHRQLLGIFGSLKEIVLPDEAAIESKVAEFFSSTGLDILDIPFSIESARASFLKTVDKVPPSDKTQEFKDGVLWADCIELLNTDDVSLVSADRAFYEGRDMSRGPAKNLGDEAATCGHTLRLFPGLTGLLDEIKFSIPINESLLKSSFVEIANDSISSLLERNLFELGRRLSLASTLYATEQPDQLAIDFTIINECIDLSGEDRTGRIILRGDGMYNAAEETFAKLRSSEYGLIFTLKDGTEQVKRSMFGSLAVHLGHREVPHTVRHKLD